MFNSIKLSDHYYDLGNKLDANMEFNTLVDIIVRVTSINGDLHGIFYELIFQATLPLLEYGENI